MAQASDACGPEPRATFVLLGAGATRGARHRLVPVAPPSGDELAGHLASWLDGDGDGDPVPTWVAEDAAYERLRALLAAIARRERRGEPIASFEVRVAEVIGARDVPLLALLNRVIALALLRPRGPFARRQDRYDALVRHLGADLVAAATLNYDVLLEQALERAGRAYAYAEIEDEAGAALPVFKFHGSCNWLQDVPPRPHPAALVPDPDAGVHVRPQPALGTTLVAEEVRVVRDHEAAYRELSRLTAPPPVLVTYGPGKPATHSRDRIDRVRAATFAAVDRAARCLVVGLRPPAPEDDPALHALLERIAQRPCPVYVTPSERHCAAMTGRGYTVRRMSLEDVLDAPIDEILAAG